MSRGVKALLEVAENLGGLRAPFYFAGGWAIDLHLGRVTREQAAALAGLAPFDDDSSMHSGIRHIGGGRERLRGSLYNAALAAAFHWNPQLIALYKRLTRVGKPHKLVLIACARKLLIFVNTVVERGTPWTSTAPPLVIGKVA